MKRIVAMVLASMAISLSFIGCTGESGLQEIGESNKVDNIENKDVEASTENEENLELKGPYKVERVVDGDTIILNIDGVSERVRLIGVDTPESVHPDADKNVEYGKVASEYTKNALEEKSVMIEMDVQERDKYDRILAYVYLDDEMFNLKLIQEGHAKILTYPPNVKYVDDFTNAQKIARDEGKGLWDYEEGSYIAKGYIGNKNSKKFHELSCSSVKSMSEDNIVEFSNREEAIGEGYEPCKKCNP